VARLFSLWASTFRSVVFWINGRRAYTIRFGLCAVCLLWSGPAPAENSGGPPRGTLYAAKALKHFTAAEIDAAGAQDLSLVGSAKCGVTVVELHYATIGVHGESADASAALLLPDVPAPPQGYPLLGWAHGTETRRAATQAAQAAKAADFELSSFYASKGYAVVASDYLGLGQSRYPFHPYLHADSEASAIVDALRAARNAGPLFGARYSGKVMLGGYSQGGHAAMAAQRAIERDYSAEFDLVGTASMSGPYELSYTFTAMWSDSGREGGEALISPLLSYAVVAMQRVYGDIYAGPENVFRPPFAGEVEVLFPGPLDLFDLARREEFAGLRSLDGMRQPAFSSSFLEPKGNAFSAALARNDLLDWTPRTPMILCGANQDSIVPFDNAVRAKAAFGARGVRVTVVDVADRIPAGVGGEAAHTQWAASLCLFEAREMLFEPARRNASAAMAHSEQPQ
jgi:hypothetical protein